MYDSSTQDVNFIFSALSADPWLQDDYYFMSVADPGEIMLKAQEGDLPGITGMLIIDE